MSNQYWWTQLLDLSQLRIFGGYFFFFSSRRRHTRSLRDWSSDVCSSDLLFASWGLDYVKVDDLSSPYHQDEIEAIRKAIDHSGRAIVFSTSPGATPVGQEIGRASCRERVWISMVDGPLEEILRSRAVCSG